ncbi:MAG: sugar phosphate isomerase/epimerase family protein [Armatimonadota bacterium]
MRMDRREFIVSGTAGLALALASGMRTDGAPAPKAVLKISSQEGRIPGRDLSEKLDRMEKWGIVGLEPGGGGLPGRVESLQRALSGRKVKISAICAGYSGCLISHEESERKKAMDSIKEILTAAGALGSTGLIVVPAFNGQTNLGHREARAILIDELKELGEHAHRHGTRVLLEPLNRSEAFFLRLLADAAAICRDVNSPGVGMMGDFYHMAIEETSDMGAFLSAGKYLHHVHLASRRRNLPGQDDRDFTDGFRGLKMIGYQDYCSFECGCIGDPEVEIPKSVKFLQEQWAKA